VHDLMMAIGIEEFTIHVNNRRVLTGLLEKLDLADQSVPILRSLDKLAKIGPENVKAEMMEAAGTTSEQASSVLELSRLTGSNDEILSRLGDMLQGNETGEQGVDTLAQVVSGVAAADVDAARLSIDVSIARGLDYYTGTVIETFLDKLPKIGSVCSGGRYDDLASVYTKQQLPGIGASLGLDRLLAAMDELGLIEPTKTPAPVFVAYFDADRLPEYLGLARQLRAVGIGTCVYPEPKKIGQQLKYADRMGFRIAVIAGSREFEAGSCQVKDLKSGSSREISMDILSEHVLELLNDR